MAQTGRSCAFPGSVACVQRQAAGLRTPARWATVTVKGEHRGPKTWERDFDPACSRSAIDRIPDSTTRTYRYVRFVPQFQPRATLPPTQAVVYERFAAGTCR